MTANFETLRQFARTPVQRATIAALIDCNGNLYHAAEQLDRHPNSIRAALTLVQAAASAQGFSPEHGLNSIVPAPFVAKGHSTLERVGPNGERTQVLQWTKTRLDEQQWAAQIEGAVAAFCADQDPLPAAPAPLVADGDIIPWIQIGDAHFGMLAHEAETGSNFDLKIAEAEMRAAIEILIDDLPEVERLVVNDLGDFTHYENMAGVTEHSRNVLDFDGRFPKMIDVYARTMRFIIEKALTKAQHVDVIVNQGNHSRTNDLWMAVLLRNVYENTGRVHILNNRSPFIGYRMGNTLVMTHHSDTCKPARLAQVMTTDFKVDWGETDYHYIDIGHIHHGMVMKEHPDVVIESFNQLAAKDKWAHDGGYRSRQSISVIYRSRRYGEIGRRLLPLRQVQDRIRETAHGADHYIAPKKMAYRV